MMRYSRRPQKKSQPVQNNFAGCRCGWAQIAIRRAFAAIYAMQAPPVLVFIYQMPSQAHRDTFEKLDIPKEKSAWVKPFPLSHPPLYTFRIITRFPGLRHKSANVNAVTKDLIANTDNLCASTSNRPIDHLMRTLLTLLFVLCLATTSAVVSARSAPDPLAARVDEFVASELKRQKIPGLAVAIVRRGEVFKAQGYGLANVEHDVAVKPATIFQSGSVGKQITAVAAMLMVEDGKLALSDPVKKYLKDAPASWEAITVRHLLTHTSGIPNVDDDNVDYHRDYTEEQYTALAYQTTLSFAAGRRWSYSNTAYQLLGFIIGKAGGKFYGEVLAKRVFKPLGMTTARVISEADIVPNRAAGYQLVSGALKNQDWVSPFLNTTADGSLYFSLLDVIAWDAGVRQRKILKAESWQQIFTPVTLKSGKSYPYGFGWDIEERAGQLVHEHGGSWQGFKTHIVRFLRDDLSIIVLANLREADPEVIVDGIAEIMNPAQARPTLSAIDDKKANVTARLRQLRQAPRAGKLSADEFARR